MYWCHCDNMWWSWRKGLQEITILVDEDWPIVSGQQQFMVLTSVLDVGMFSFVLWQFVAGDDWCSKLFEATKHKLMLDMDVNVEKLLSKCEKWVWKKCLLWSVKVCDCTNWNENCYIVLFLWFEKVLFCEHHRLHEKWAIETFDRLFCNCIRELLQFA